MTLKFKKEWQSVMSEGGRSAGVLLHVTSLPGRFGIGDLGAGARRFIDQLASARQTWWQMLPLGPAGAGNSPYQCFSAFAGNPLLIDLQALVKDGLLARSDLPSQRFGESAVEYSRVARAKTAAIDRAAERFFSSRGRLRQAFERFTHDARWLDDYALFMALRAVHKREAWQLWPREIVLRKPQALRDARSALSEQVDRQRFTQFIFFRQLDALRAHARRRRVRLLGDMPIFVSHDSADVWANAELFLLDRRTRRPMAVAGVPPDYFSKTGQRWGNPLYDWNAMARDGYHWWIERCRAALRQADIVRMDHFRGFVASWHVPARAKTARRGRWVPGPGARLFDALREALGGLPFLAEDLGVITAPVRELRQSLDLPGMAVLHFAFANDGKNPFLPHHHRRNSVVYTGTHDNDTTLGWFRSLNATTRKTVRSYVPEVDGDPAAALMRVAYGSVAHTAIVPLQDVLSLGSGARMNVPGRARGNWNWRFREEQFTDAHVYRLAELAAQYDRAR